MISLDLDNVADGEALAVDDEPRPGVANYQAQQHRLTQDETDVLIVTELHRLASLSQYDELTRLTHPPRLVVLTVADDFQIRVYHQRGGISSDPLVRLLAFRAWGNRDRKWVGVDELDRRTMI